MVRKCSHCGRSGHNSRTCLSSRVHGGGGVKLFGVQLLLGDHRPIISYLSSSTSLSSSSSSSSSSLASIDEATQSISNGYYLFEGHGGRAQERKKGVPWSEEEHRSFLAGLEELGKGDWRGISRKFVITRTPTQVASHAQKYFLRQSSSLDGRKRRTSLFDAVTICQKACQKAVPSNSKSKRDKPAPFDLNSSSQEQEIELPSCLDDLFSQSYACSTRFRAQG